MELSISINIPYLWGSQTFLKNEWGAINFLVGPNGTGKSLFAEQLRVQCDKQGVRPRYLSAERLAGLERQGYGSFGFSHLARGLDVAQFSNYRSQGLSYGLAADAFVTLKEKLDVRIRIGASLSQLFGRTIRLAEEGGFLDPKIQKIRGAGEYGLREAECHGLKELIALLTFVHDDQYGCLIIDEPELHLHPQFQAFFLQELRKAGGDPRSDSRKKCFFLITHSPYFIDFRTSEDLRHCVVFQPDRLPVYLEQFDSEDERQIRRFVPRLNTHHKQFFFASRPIFVEGYLDQQLFSLIQERAETVLGAAGACFIDVGGKDEMELFFRLCRRLGIEAQFIADLDCLLQGKLRQTVSRDSQCQNCVQGEGLGTDLMTALGQLETAIDTCLEAVEGKTQDAVVCDPSTDAFRHALITARQSADARVRMRYVFLLGLRFMPKTVRELAIGQSGKVAFIEGRLARVLEVFKRSGIHILSGGELENYLPAYTGDRYTITNSVKTGVFEKERAFILEECHSAEQLRSRYGELIDTLERASRSKTVIMESHLNVTIGDWVHKVQSAVRRGEVHDAQSLAGNASVDWKTYSRIAELLEFSVTEGGFTCRARLKALVDPAEREFSFNQNTVAASYEL